MQDSSLCLWLQARNVKFVWQMAKASLKRAGSRSFFTQKSKFLTYHFEVLPFITVSSCLLDRLDVDWTLA